MQWEEDSYHVLGKLTSQGRRFEEQKHCKYLCALSVNQSHTVPSKRDLCRFQRQPSWPSWGLTSGLSVYSTQFCREEEKSLENWTQGKKLCKINEHVSTRCAVSSAWPVEFDTLRFVDIGAGKDWAQCGMPGICPGLCSTWTDSFNEGFLRIAPETWPPA